MQLNIATGSCPKETNKAQFGLWACPVDHVQSSVHACARFACGDVAYWAGDLRPLAHPYHSNLSS